MGVPLGDEGHLVGVLIGRGGEEVGLGVLVELANGTTHIGLVAGADAGLESALLEDGQEDLEEGHLRLGRDVASLLLAALLPVAGVGLVEGFEGLELDAVLILVMLADVDEVVGEVGVVVLAEVVAVAVAAAADASALGHPPGAAVAEGLELGVGTQLLDAQHDAALCLVALPVVFASAFVLEAFHLGTVSLAPVHVVGGAVAVLGIVATADVIAEEVPVEAGGADHPLEQLVELRLAPLAALSGPPAEADAPSLADLTLGVGEDGVSVLLDEGGGVGGVGKAPAMLGVGSGLVGEAGAARRRGVGAQVLTRLLVLQQDVVAALLDGVACAGCAVADLEVGAPGVGRTQLQVEGRGALGEGYAGAAIGIGGDGERAYGLVCGGEDDGS